ncbi:MAG: thermitase [Saprospiraceae bacterium]|mgnify:CR=1 FL=1|jgi:thermitase
MILYNILIFTFGFWNIFKKNKSLSPLLGFSFMVAFAFWVFTTLGSVDRIDTKVFEGLYVLFGLSILGFILISLSKNKIAQVGAVVLASVGLNLYVSNPHTTLHPSIEMDQEAELIVQIDNDDPASTIAELKELTFIKYISPFLEPKDFDKTELDDFYKIDIKEGYDINRAVSEISQQNGVEWIEPNEILRLEPVESVQKTQRSNFSASVTDPLADSQWNMAALNMQDYYPLFEKSKFRPVRTAKLFILDSGVNPNHEDIGSNFLRHKSNDVSGNESDGNGHGTHCAGVASAISNNGIGVASMSPGNEWITVSSVKVMNNFGFGTQASIIEGIIEAVDAGADVISMSLGGRSTQIKEEAYDEALKYAEDHNVIIIAAAGNNAGDASQIVPANSKIVITVTALDKSLNKAQFSNYITNTNYGIAAPGTSIPSTWKGGKYATFDGTSMAAPHVSGLVAVMRSLKPSLTTKQAFEILDQTGTKTKANHLTGRMINPTKAIIATR